MDHEALLRSAHRWLVLAVVALGLGAGTLSWTKAWSQGSSGTLVCSGQMTQSPGMDWAKSGIEFSLPYGPGIVAPLVRIAQLQVSRQTGRFSLRAEMTPESSGMLVGTAVWEGTCAPGKALEKKF